MVARAKDCAEADDYRVERAPDGGVRIGLGLLPSFDVPPDAAFKLAALLLKSAGYEVKLNNSRSKLIARRSTAHPIGDFSVN